MRFCCFSINSGQIRTSQLLLKLENVFNPDTDGIKIDTGVKRFHKIVFRTCVHRENKDIQYGKYLIQLHASGYIIRIRDHT